MSLRFTSLVSVGIWLAASAAASAPGSGDWPTYDGNADRTGFSSLNQITRENVGALRVAWVYHAGGNSDELGASLECNPVVVRGVMYVTSPVMEVIALDAATGRQIWKYNPFPERPSYARAWAAGGLVLLAGVGLVWFLWRFARLQRLRPARPVTQFSTLGIALILFMGGVETQKLLLTRVMRHILPDPHQEQKYSGPLAA